MSAHYRVKSPLTISEMRISRYEATLWRQVGQLLFTLDALDRLVHNAHRLQLTGESMRKQNARNQTLDAASNA